jgi:hypothetical protein
MIAKLPLSSSLCCNKTKRRKWWQHCYCHLFWCSKIKTTLQQTKIKRLKGRSLPSSSHSGFRMGLASSILELWRLKFVGLLQAHWLCSCSHSSFKCIGSTPTLARMASKLWRWSEHKIRWEGGR